MNESPFDRAEEVMRRGKDLTAQMAAAEFLGEAANPVGFLKLALQQRANVGILLRIALNYAVPYLKVADPEALAEAVTTMLDAHDIEIYERLGRLLG